MITLGKYNTLIAARETANGIYLKDVQEEEVLLPNKLVPKNLKMGEQLSVFVFNDSEDRPTATTQQPKIQLNEFAYLKVNEVNRFGAFLDWGMDKDLLVPFKEQAKKMEEGKWYFVYLYLDEETNRLVASGKLNRFFQSDSIDMQEGQEVDLLINFRTDLGVNVIINNRYKGLIYKSDLFQEIKPGDRRKGFIKRIRPDNKIDVTLRKEGYSKVPDGAHKIIEKLKQNDGFLNLSDKSKPSEIYELLGMSKKTFKKAIGGMYKRRMIRIEKNGIYWIEG